MRFFGENGGGSFPIDNISGVTINSELGVPADDLTVVIVGADVPSLWKIYALKDGAVSIEDAKKRDAVIFDGYVDEQVSGEDKSGKTVTVYARSPASLPLDSECGQAEYLDPTADVIFRKHLSCFGIENTSGKTSSKSGVMSITKGQSHYTAVRRFCEMFLGSECRINGAGKFYPDVRDVGGRLSFGEGGIGFYSITIREKRCLRVSQVTAESSSGEIVVKNEDAIRCGIVRQRRMSLFDSATGTLSDADAVIKRGEENSLVVTLRCGGYLGDIIGCSACVSYGELDGKEFSVIKTKYSSGSSGKETVVVLRQRRE